METIPVDWKRATKVWWSLAWRNSLLFVLLRLLFETWDIVAPAFLVPDWVFSTGVWVLTGLALLGGTIVNIWIVKFVLSKQYSDFAVVLTSRPTTGKPP